MAALAAALTSMADEPKIVTGFDYRWFLRRVLPDRHGMLCRIVGHPREYGGQWAFHRGEILIEFTDGTRVTCSRVAIKRMRRALP